MPVWGVVVARVRNGPKSRLAGVLDYDQRHRLAMAMLADVLAVCAAAASPLDRVVAVVDSAEAASLAESYGALPVPDTGGDMNNAVQVGIEIALRRGAQTAIVLPGDIPLARAADLDALLAAGTDFSRVVVIGASHDLQGTNALLLRPPDVTPPAFGPPSVQRHVRLAESAGAIARVVTNLGLSRDVDTPADLAAIADLPVGPTTARLLASEALRSLAPSRAH